MVDAIIFALVIILLILALKASLKHFRGQGSCCSSSTTAVPMKKLEKPAQKKRLTVEGMHCTHCQDRVHRALDGISGAAVESISWKEKTVVLATEREIPDELIARVIENEGYRLTKSEAI